MHLEDVINQRRAYRSLEEAEITGDVVRSLAEAASLSASCFNNQPWRFVFVFGPGRLEALKRALSRGNAWATRASMIIAVASRKSFDCDIHESGYQEREYFLFDTGMATAHLILKATELGLVAHPIAGYNEKAAKEATGIPDDMKLITLVIVGKRAPELDATLSEKQRQTELSRPARKRQEEIAFIDRYAEPDGS